LRKIIALKRTAPLQSFFIVCSLLFSIATLSSYQTLITMNKRFERCQAMETDKTSQRIHPLVAGAAISVMVVSVTAVAALTGLLPTSHGFLSSAVPAVASSSNHPNTESGTAANALQVPSPVSSVLPVTTVPPSTPYRVDSPISASAVPESVRYVPPAVPVAHVCVNCGRVIAVHAIRHTPRTSGIGVVAGSVLGGVLGNQIGNGNGRTLATVAGAVGGGFAGNEVEKRTHTTTSYQVQVRMENGKVRSFPYASQPQLYIGEHVQVTNGVLKANG
jgi:outer membrane lipoprotein SlyB